MGYYPTPLPVADKVRSYLKFPQDNASLFDPCCGEGQALKKLGEHAKATTYGIELDEYRAKQAKATLDHVIKGSYDDAKISNNVFSCLFLNPPYDWETARDAARSERTEKAFLKGTIRYLQPSGTLIYIIPQNWLTGDVARILSFRFDDCSAFRFPDDEYERFRQIVLFAVKKPRESLDEKAFSRMKRIPGQTLEAIPYSSAPLYDLPPSKAVHMFRSSAIDEAELEKELIGSVLWKQLCSSSSADNGNLGRPPLPLHTGHLGLLLANGCLDGVVGKGRDKHIVRGKVEKITNKFDEHDGDAVVEREVDSYRVSIKLLKKDGDILTLM